MKCTFPCARPDPPCGHPKTLHSCHEDGPCPSCPHLTTKLCACGKTDVNNIRYVFPMLSSPGFVSITCDPLQLFAGKGFMRQDLWQASQIFFSADDDLKGYCRLLDCGFHPCDRPCHGGDCGGCTQICGKLRKLW